MAELHKQAHGFGLNVLSNLGASAMISLIGALWQRSRHGAVDWIGIAGLFVVTCVVFFLLVRVIRRNETPPAPKLLTPLQVEALRLATDLLLFVKRLGPEPMPKYTHDEIQTMPESKRRALIDAQDGDYAEACEFYSREAVWFYPRTWQNIEGMTNEIMARWNRLYPWYQKVASSYSLEYKDKVENIRHRFIVEGLEDDALSKPVEGRDGAENICRMASALWQLAYKVRAREELK